MTDTHECPDCQSKEIYDHDCECESSGTDEDGNECNECQGQGFIGGYLECGQCGLVGDTDDFERKTA